MENYNILNKVWNECLQDKLMPDINSRIIGVETQMSNFSLLFGLHYSERILRITDNFSKTLQLKSFYAAEAQVIVGQTIKILMSIAT